MKNVKFGKTADISYDISDTPDGAVTVDLTHEWGDSVATGLSTTLDSGTTYVVHLTSAHTSSVGKLKLSWKYSVSSVGYTKNTYINVYQQYIDSLTFFGRNEDLEDEWGDRFDEFELKVQNVIDTYCGQNFGFRENKTISLDGDGSRNLYLPIRLESLDSVTMVTTSSTTTETDDITDILEVHPESKFFIRMKNPKVEFGDAVYFSIVGDWGWPYVPTNVTDAADLILVDWMDDDSNYRKHGVSEVYMDTHRMRFHDTIFGSTGNIDADTLLMDYTLYLMTLI